MRLKITLILAFLMVVQLAQAQFTVKGKVVDSETNEVLIGVNVVAKGTTVGTSTGLDGTYSIDMPEGTSALIFSYTGYNGQTIEVNGQTTIDVSLSQGVDISEEVVVVGYQVKKKSDLTGAVAEVDMDEIGKVPYSSVLQAMQGRVAGVIGTQDGQPGAGRNQLRIRGLTTFGGGSGPLFVVDGVPVTEDVSRINPNDIESISVLKDAAAASIYGSRSAGGVIIITTKKGKKGKLSVDAGVLTGIQTIGRRIDLLNATQWGEVYWDASRNFNPNITPSHPQYGDGENPIINTAPFLIENGRQLYQYTEEGTDWYDAVYRRAFQQQYYVNLAAGTDKSNMMFGLSYFDQDGLILNTNHERVTARLNSQYKFTDWFTVGENASIALTDEVQVGTQQGQDGIPTDVLRQHPLLPVLAFPDFGPKYAGKIDGFPDVRNMVGVLDANQNNNTEAWRVFANVYAEANILDAFSATRENHDLRLKSSYTLEYSNFFRRQFNASFQEGDFDVQGNSLFVEFGKGLTKTFINTLQYTYDNGGHNFNFLAGTEAIRYDFEFTNGSQTNFEIETPDFTVLGAGAGDVTAGGGGSAWGLLSYFGRADYTFDRRYLASFTLRYDQTSRLNTAGYFPAASFGWVLTEEKFFQDMMGENDIFSNIKLRASWGQQGNQLIGDFSTLSFLGGDKNHADYDITGSNNSFTQGYRVLSLGNPNLVWETTTQTNIGADFALWDYKLDFSIDYFRKASRDILTRIPQITALGEGDLPFANTASMTNSGIDLNLRYAHLSENNYINFNAQFQASILNNEVTFVGDESSAAIGPDGNFYLPGLDGATRIAVGQSFGVFYGYQVEGIFQTQEEANAHPDQTGRGNKVGRLKYADLNGDSLINDLDRTYLGDAYPDFTLGLNLEVSYKNFTLTAFFYAAIGQQVYNENKWYTDFAQSGLFNHSTRTLDAWTPENNTSTIPMLTIDDEGNNESRASSYFVEDADFLKLRTLRLGYQVPERWTKNYRVNVYAEAQNVFVITNYTGIDPEVPYAGNANTPGIDRGSYPIPRTFLLGVNVKL